MLRGDWRLYLFYDNCLSSLGRAQAKQGTETLSEHWQLALCPGHFDFRVGCGGV